MILKFIKRSIKKAIPFLLGPFILLKFLYDARSLPLNKNHWRLYRMIHVLMFLETRSFPDLRDPKSFNDKIQWLKLFDQDHLIVQCCDKLNMREFVNANLGKQHLPELYCEGGDTSSIQLEALPNKFVLKTNHDSGTVFLVRNKAEIDWPEIKKDLNSSLSRVFGWEFGEWAYSMVKPRVFAESFLGDTNSKTPPADYKFHCSEGKVLWLQYIYDRHNGTKETLVNRDGVVIDNNLDHAMIHSKAFQKPDNFSEMVAICEKLSQRFKYVRVDLYNINNTVIVGELTFYPLRGCYKGIGQQILGGYMNFNLKTFKDPIYMESKEFKSTPETLGEKLVSYLV